MKLQQAIDMVNQYKAIYEFWLEGSELVLYKIVSKAKWTPRGFIAVRDKEEQGRWATETDAGDEKILISYNMKFLKAGSVMEHSSSEIMKYNTPNADKMHKKVSRAYRYHLEDKEV